MPTPEPAPTPAQGRGGLALLLAALAAATLVSGLAGGLARLGVPLLPAAASAPLALHGALMLCGFFGFVIALERAAALRWRAVWAAPALAAAGSAAALALQPGLAAIAWLGAALALATAYAVVWQHEPALHTGIEGAGALAWAGGTLLWLLDRPFEVAVAWWCAFLVLTIAGERRELARFVPLGRFARRSYLAVIGLQGLALVALVLPGVPVRGAGALWWFALLALAAWLLRFDLACRPGLVRSGWTLHTARCLRLGYAWLALAALWALVGLLRGTAFGASGPLHMLLLGFVFAMVFGHAPIVLPALLRRRLAAPTPAQFAPVLLMSAAVALRAVTEALDGPGPRVGAALLQVLAIVLFGVLLVARLR
jgi:hypothetical protein